MSHFPLRSFTFAWYRQMAENTPLLEALQASLKVAVSVAVISTVLGVLAAKALTRYDLPGRAPITGFIMLPLVIPSLVLALALLVVLRRILDVELSLYTVAAGHVMLCVPYRCWCMISRLEGFDRSLEEASTDLGDNAWQTFWRVTFPLAWPGIVSSLLLCFSASFDEYVLAVFLSGNREPCRSSSSASCAFPSVCPACSRWAAASCWAPSSSSPLPNGFAGAARVPRPSIWRRRHEHGRELHHDPRRLRAFREGARRR